MLHSLLCQYRPTAVPYKSDFPKRFKLRSAACVAVYVRYSVFHKQRCPPTSYTPSPAGTPQISVTNFAYYFLAKLHDYV
jgi:hypothetical protein